MVNVLVLGVGNAASALVQLIQMAKGANSPFEGFIYPKIGPYGPGDISIVGALDVHEGKVGRDLAEAIHVAPNNTRTFATVPPIGVTVKPGYLGDGIAKHLRNNLPLVPTNKKEAASFIRASDADICIAFLPAGSKRAAAFYAKACLDAGISFINSGPEPLASDPDRVKAFKKAGLILAGDDIQSAIGANFVSRTIARGIRERGGRIKWLRQFNRGGTPDFESTFHPDRLASKERSKTEGLAKEAGTKDVVATLTGYDPALGPTKVMDLRILGKICEHIPLKLNVRLEIDDGPNNALSMIDVVRLTKLALDRGISGTLDAFSYYFKSPPRYVPIARQRQLVDTFLAAA